MVLLFASAARAGGARVSAEAEARIDEGIKALYDLDYAKARRAARRLIEAEPDNPFGYLFESGAIWWQSSQEYGLFKDTPTLQGLFEQDIEAALRKADAYIDSKNRLLKIDGYFVSGMTLGTRGQWSLMKGKWLDAYFDGKKAMKHLKKCVKLEENYEDAYLGLGIFDYQAAHLSGIAKLGVLFGMRGDEKRGLERIRRAADNSRFAGRQAAQFLASIYLIDKRDDASALPLIIRLRKDFPSSPYFLFLEGLIRRRLGEKDASLALGREFHAAVAADPKSFRRKWLTLACGLSGDACLSTEAAEGTLAWIDDALAASAKDKNGGFHAALRLPRALTLDVLGRREEAVVDYRAVLSRPALDGAHAAARACLAAPCGREVVLASLRAMSKIEDAP